MDNTVSSSGGPTTNALNGKLNFEQDKNRIIGRDDNNLGRLLIISDVDDFSMKVSKPTKEVIGADDDDLIFNSNQNVFKIVKAGVETVTTPTPLVANTTYSKTYSHGLGYVPAFLGYVTLPASTNVVTGYSGTNIMTTPYSLQISVGTQDRPVVALIRADINNLYFEVINYQSTGITDANGNWVFRYYLLQESAT